MSVRRTSVLLLLCFLSVAPMALAASDVVISQVYGGGGNSGAQYRHDYIELFNRGTASVSLTGWSVQYASSTGSSWLVTPLSGSIGPGKYYLIQQAAGASTTAPLLPAPDLIASPATNMSATTGKVALVSSTSPLTGTCPTGANVIDFVGFGAANCFEGTGATAALSNTTAAHRAGSGCTDTDRNNADFAVAAPAPRNGSTATNTCQTTTPNAAPSIAAFANPVATKAQDAAPFQVSFSGSDDKNVFNWSAVAGAGISSAAVSAGQGTASATYTVTLQPGFSGTATFTVSLSDNVNPAATAAATVTVTAAPPPALDHIVISQIYGGGGNSGATFRNDFIELYNPTNAAVNLGGWTVQYSSATGTGAWQFQPLGGIMQPGEYYLIALASSGSTGATLPTANVNGTINMSASAGKVALVQNGDPLDGCPVATVVDLVGFGSANCREGASNAPSGSNTASMFRKNGGFTDTNVNGNDFETGTPNPRRTTPIQEIGPALLSSEPRANGTNAPRDATISISFSEAVEVDGGWYTVNCATSGNHNSATVAGGGTAWHITPNANFTPGEQCTVTIAKQFVRDTDLDDSAPNTDTLASDYTFTFTVATGAAPAYPADVHLVFGNPNGATADVNTPDNYLMEKPEFTLSYNRGRGTPNWVSWHLADEWVGTLARVDTFRPDPQVPADWYRVLHTDYSASGFDRGHMVPNADRDPETSAPINQATFLMTNMIPQSPDNNQGPWANMENYLRTLLPANELYIIAGGAGTGGTGSNGFMTTLAGGKITVPAQTWKVAIVIPKMGGNDVARVTAATRTIAVIMPNTQGIRNNDWMGYLTTIDAVEALTGYDFFANVPDAIENAIEAGVNGVNPPGVENQTFSTKEDVAGSFTIAAESSSSNPLTYTIVAAPQHGTLTGTGATQTYTPAPDFNGTDSFTFRVSDGSRSSNTATATITVLEVNDAPTAANDARTTSEDTPLQFAAYQLTSNDSAGPANESNQTLTVSSVAATSGGTVTLTGGIITYTPAANFNGAASFNYTVCDNGFTAGAANSRCATATVNVDVTAVNDAPSASVNAPASGVEGSAVNATVSVTDVDANDSATIAWSVTKNGAPFASGTGASVAFTPNDNGTYAISVTATDAAGATGSASATVAVSNAAPVVTALSGPTSPIALGGTATISVVFGDAGAADTHTALFTWADGSTSAATCTAGVCTASRTYTAAGVYSVAITVSDDDGASASASFEGVVVYNVSGGFITGGGFINTASGKATLNVDARYQKNATTPQGHTKFDVAGSSFASTSYDWLVITGTTAQLQGTGTINGNGSYRFLATATDNGPNDTFRLKVWDKTTGAVVYDSGVANVNGGNLTIH